MKIAVRFTAKEELKAKMGSLLEEVGEAQAQAVNAEVGKSNIVGWSIDSRWKSI